LNISYISVLNRGVRKTYRVGKSNKIIMKKLNKISRENLKSIKGGITQECALWWASGKPYYSNEATCLQAPSADPTFPTVCTNQCGRWYVAF
jgi:hypothetical protein